MPCMQVSVCLQAEEQIADEYKKRLVHNHVTRFVFVIVEIVIFIKCFQLRTSNRTVPLLKTHPSHPACSAVYLSRFPHRAPSFEVATAFRVYDEYTATRRPKSAG